MSRVNVPNFFDKLLEVRACAEKQRNKDMGRVYLQIVKFVEECSYTTYKNAKKLVSYKLSGYSDPRVGQMLGIEPVTVRNHKMMLSNSLYKLFGFDFFSLFEDFSENKEEVSKRLFVAINSTKNSRGFMPLEIVESIQSNGTFKAIEPSNIYECQEEIAFLVKHCNATIAKEMSSLSKGKLDYLLRVLDGQTGSLEDRYKLIYLLGSTEA